MKQVLQSLKDGVTELAEVPAPGCAPGRVLVRTEVTLVSTGTERMLVDFGKANILEKARQQPDQVKMVLNKVKTDGLKPTIDAVRSKLDQPLALGYCNVGAVLDSGGSEFEIGQRIVSNGNHAEVVLVPKNLCARIPEEVDNESAAFTVLGAIALQGVRLAAPTIGETVVVTGLGLIGLLTVQILRANGCRVIGIDFDPQKCGLAKKFGAEVVNLSNGEDPIARANLFSRGRGVDAVIITASTKNSEPVHQAANMCRKRGRIVLVGVVGLELSRADFYEKELSFQVSCSYGPGRYDIDYEDKGHDYPIGFVRWTEQRNFEAVLDLMAQGQLDVKPLITHCFNIEEAVEAYKVLDDRSALGILLNYPSPVEDRLGRNVFIRAQTAELPNMSDKNGKVVCAFLGAGNYASRVLIPAFSAAGAVLDTLVTSGGISAAHHGKKNGFAKASTDAQVVFENEKINTVAIATQHNMHSRQVVSSLNFGKNVFVEKPLALTEQEIDEIEETYHSLAKKPRVLVGFNRRFAPLVKKMKELLLVIDEPKSFIMTMNAGSIPKDHWTQNPEIGGGRIIGEACHFIDLMRYLAGAKITSYSAVKMGSVPGVGVTEDKASITLTFEDGSFGTIFYLANGGKNFPKERVEVFCNDAVLQLDNFRSLKGFGWKGFTKIKKFSQDKGQKACAKAFVDAVVSGSDSPIEFEELIEVSRISVKIADSLRV